jgi:L-lactate dehydrogenase (cytochrome)
MRIPDLPVAANIGQAWLNEKTAIRRQLVSIRETQRMSTTIQADTPQATPVAANVAARKPPAADRRFARYLALDDFEAAAKRHLPRMLYGFISGGAETNAARQANLDSYQDYAFIPRVLADVSRRSHGKMLFGRAHAAPFGIAPMGASAICAYRGDLVFAQAAAAANIPMILSAASLIKLEEIRAAGPTAWYQAYLPGDAARIEPLVDRVAAAGYEVFVLTVDVPVSANRENNVRSGFSIPIKPSAKLAWDVVAHPGWSVGTFARTVMQHGMPHFENMDATRGPPVISRNLERALGNRDQMSWEHVELIRRRWKGPFVIKGVLSVADARAAKDHGVDGIMVSNHGGRQLDGAIAPLRALPHIAEAARGMTVILDGGIRRGTDVLKALALGADFVFAGRPFLYAAAVGGEAGVRHAIELLSTEVSRDMALLGVSDLSEVRPELITRTRP